MTLLMFYSYVRNHHLVQGQYQTCLYGLSQKIYVLVNQDIDTLNTAYP